MKDVKGYEGLYGITSCGRVWSYKYKKFLTPRDNGKGYLRVALTKDGYVKEYYIHRLVAQAYIDNPQNKSDVNHMDENPLHNYLNNLEWTTHKENVNYGNRTKKTYKAVYCIELDKVFESQSKEDNELNVSIQAINLCLKGKSKTCCGYHLQYA